MKIRIHCPNCKNKIRSDEFSQIEEPREYYCEACNTSFYTSMVEEGDRHDEIIKGSTFNLTFENKEGYPWNNLNNNLEPDLTCMLCTGQLGGIKDGDNQFKKCRKCEAIFNITLS